MESETETMSLEEWGEFMTDSYHDKPELYYSKFEQSGERMAPIVLYHVLDSDFGRECGDIDMGYNSYRKTIKNCN